VKGKDAQEIFQNESGGHRWQRIPPTEKKGRRQTSTITVAVLKEFQNKDVKLTHDDVDYKATRASGKGGQKRNKVHTAVQLTHKKTGFRVDCCEGVSQRRNRDKALKRMEKRLNKTRKKKARAERSKIRKEQVGSGMRGDKVRTIQCYHNIVKNHVNGKQTSYKRYAGGYVDDLH
jgi:peptide chain release factor 1